ncbi:energy transducer TonB [Algicola sagamiensis]|uniref:energy transducer TonB n=1 Tax=Algicola sagamiensis TaxID=163869 RepID=UPI000A007705|nr:energy transducer TonB [Algicola sagamiensis]
MRIKSLLLGFSLSLASFVASADLDTVDQWLNEGKYEKAMVELKSLARFGNVEAQFKIAQMHEQGLGTEANMNKALAWYMLAHENKHPDARAKYLELRANVPSRREVKSLLKVLNQMYGKGAIESSLFPLAKSDEAISHEARKPTKTVNPDYSTIKNVSQQGAWSIVRFDINENGEVENPDVLSSFPKGLIDQRVLSALKQWRYKTEQNVYGEPIRISGVVEKFTLQPKDGTAKAKVKTARNKHIASLKRKAKKGNDAARFEYALLQEFQIADRRNMEEAVKNYLTSAKAGHTNSQYRIAQCLNHGDICEPDRNKAYTWLTYAANKLHQRAAYELAMELLNIENIEYNPKEAARLLKDSAVQGYMPAITQYAQLLVMSNDPQIRNPKKAIQYAEQARTLDKNSPILLSTLGIAYSEIGMADKGSVFLNQAVTEAASRGWSTDNYLDLIEDYKEASMLANDAP